MRLTGNGIDSTAITGSDGRYIFTGLANGTYTITPNKSGYIFSPASQEIMVSGGNAAARDITAFSFTVDTIVVQGITFVSIPGGTFQMGTNATDNSWLIHSRPVHSVTLDSFQMGRYEITRAQYEALMGYRSFDVSGPESPVWYVTWYDAVRFCNKLSKAAGLDSCYNLSTWACDFTKNGYRLPTEAEWEYACRAGTTTKYYTGDTESDLAKAGWYQSNSGLTTHAVGGKEANAFGLYDMHGNVDEWCNDWWTDYYTANSENNPQGPSTGSNRVRVGRGGCWSDAADNCLSATRMRFDMYTSDQYLGFRVVRR